MFFEEVRLVGGPLDGTILVSGVDDLNGFPHVRPENSPFDVDGCSYAWDHVEGSICYLKYVEESPEGAKCRSSVSE